MKPVTIAAVSLLGSLANGSPLEARAAESVNKRQTPGPGSYYAITGPTGGVQTRLEIRELEKTGEMWNLYLLALSDFQAMDQNLIDSWFQIAGIHGMPWTSWDGVEGTAEGKDASQKGYCTHNQQMFGTWHRPYLLLFEQKLQSIAKSIADQFPTSTRSKYQDAANALRTPFWDWAKALPNTQPVIPSSLTTQTIQVTFPNSTTALIDNPLYDYNFHPLDHSQINGTGCATIGTPNGPVGGSPEVCDNSTKTVRRGYPESDHAALESRLRDILPTQRKNLLSILSQYQPFDAFSNGGSCAIGGAGDLESLHNPIHTNNWPGHMSPASVSAFDPMFWLHHANVDRQMALFQAVFPDTYVNSCPADTPTFTTNIGDIQNADSSLTPFHRDKAGAFWTSALARNIANLGYTYPELVGNPSNATLVANIKSQYAGPANGSTTANTKRQQNSLRNETVYFADVKIAQYGLSNGAGGSSPYNVLVFLGDVGNDSTKWIGSDSFVGMASTIAGHNMQTRQSTVVKVDLQIALEKAISSGATTTAKAADYLKKNLHWRIELGDFEIPREKVPAVEVRLVSTQVQIAASDDVFDRWVGGFSEYGLVDA